MHEYDEMHECDEMYECIYERIRHYTAATTAELYAAAAAAAA